MTNPMNGVLELEYVLIINRVGLNRYPLFLKKVLPLTQDVNFSRKKGNMGKLLLGKMFQYLLIKMSKKVNNLDRETEKLLFLLNKRN
jgi:hypothetical protein